jgi:hypothetical protein
MRQGRAANSLMEAAAATVLLSVLYFMAAPPWQMRARTGEEGTGTGLPRIRSSAKDTRGIGSPTWGDDGCKDGRSAVKGRLS